MNDNPLFNGFKRPSTDFSAVRSHLQTQTLYFDVDLSTARSIDAGTQLVVPLAGNFLYIDQRPNTGIASVRFEDPTKVNMPYTVFPGCVILGGYTQICIENTAQPGLSMRIAYGTDVQFSPSNTAGVSVLNSISVVDGAKARTLAKQAFSFPFEALPVAARYSVCGIWNPPGSGKRAVIDWVSYSVENIYSRPFISSTVLATLNAIPAANCLLSGGSASVMKSAVDNTVASVRAGANGSFSWTSPSGLTDLRVVELTRPIVIRPGYGFYLEPEQQNSGAKLNMQWFEEDDT